MDGVNKNELAREELLDAVAALNASRDDWMECAELLREHQFNFDLVSRSAAAESANELINRSRDMDRG